MINIYQHCRGTLHSQLSSLTLVSKKGKSSPFSITKHRVPELILVFGSQPAGDVSHKPSGRLPLISACGYPHNP